MDRRAAKYEKARTRSTQCTALLTYTVAFYTLSTFLHRIETNNLSGFLPAAIIGAWSVLLLSTHTLQITRSLANKIFFKKALQDPNERALAYKRAMRGWTALTILIPALFTVLYAHYIYA